MKEEECPKCYKLCPWTAFVYSRSPNNKTRIVDQFFCEDCWLYFVKIITSRRQNRA